MLGPEVLHGARGEPLGDAEHGARGDLLGFDAVLVAGQAKSHCVAWTVDDLLSDAPEIAPRLYLLEDCTSPVVVPGAVDYTDDADAAFAASRMRERTSSARPSRSRLGPGRSERRSLADALEARVRAQPAPDLRHGLAVGHDHVRR